LRTVQAPTNLAGSAALHRDKILRGFSRRLLRSETVGSGVIIPRSSTRLGVVNVTLFPDGIAAASRSSILCQFEKFPAATRRRELAEKLQSLERSCDPETEQAVAGFRRLFAALGRPKVTPGGISPRAAPQYT
jgi:hypothetical protein